MKTKTFLLCVLFLSLLLTIALKMRAAVPPCQGNGTIDIPFGGPDENKITDDHRDLPNVCPVHQKKLQPDIVPVLYGLLISLEGYPEAAEKDFPYANKDVSGGCVVIAGCPGKARTRYCPDCRAALEKWEVKLAEEWEQREEKIDQENSEQENADHHDHETEKRLPGNLPAAP